jgi:hypothetical protein
MIYVMLHPPLRRVVLSTVCTTNIFFLHFSCTRLVSILSPLGFGLCLRPTWVEDVDVFPIACIIL